MNLNKEILRLALPSIVSNITVPLLGIVDVTIMGHIGDARYIGAIAVGSMIFNVVYWLFVFLRMGTSGLTAQAFGRGKGGACLILRQSLTVALVSGLLIVLLQWPLRLLAFRMMGATPDVEELVLPYFNICVWGAPAVLGLYSLMGWFVGMQNTRVPMMIAIGQNIINILASLIFVFVLHMQVEGVALGTVVAQWTGFIWAILRSEKLKAKCEDVLLSESEKSVTAPQVSTFFTLQSSLFPLFLRTLCLVCVNFYFTSVGAQQGALMLAVNTLLMQLFTIFSYFMDGFANAGEALVGRFYGANDRKSFRRAVRLLFGWGAVMVVLFTGLYGLGGETFLSLLTNDHTVVEASRTYLPWAVFIPLCGVAAFVWDGVFIGLMATRGMLLSCFVAAVMFFIVWATGGSSMGNHALWLALLVYLALRGIVQTVIFLYFPWSFQK